MIQTMIQQSLRLSAKYVIRHVIIVSTEQLIARLVISILSEETMENASTIAQ